MNYLENIRVALDSVRSNWLRAILTLSIIAFGIMALVGILTAIDSAIYSLNDNFSGLGANSFNINPKGEGVSGNQGGRRSKRGEEISFKQAMDFKERFNVPSRVSVSLGCTSMATVKFEDQETNPNVPVTAVDENYLLSQGYNIAFGRNFSPKDIENGNNFAIIGMDIVNTIFRKQPQRAINQMISVANVKYKVIAVLESKGSGAGSNSDRLVWVPLTNGKRYYGTNDSNYGITVQVNNAEDMDLAVGQATGLLRTIRRLKLGQEDDFEIFKDDSLIGIIKDNTTYLRLAAVGIGLMTLIGAAIGLMNIMLVSVTERTRKVGIRKALGATRRNIMLQFLTEAIVICQLGGILGILLGVLIGNIVTMLTGGAFLVPWVWMISAFITCMAVGLISGIYPAMKASRLDPIESLRFE